MTVTIGSGLGGFAAIAQQPTYGATFVTPTRTLTLKANKPTFDPHITQGGPYLANGRIVDLASAHIQTYLDAKGTLSGDMMNTGAALLLLCAIGAKTTLKQVGTTTAYELGGSSGVSIAAPEQNEDFFDMQMGVPTADGTLQKFNYHSCMIAKAEWVFDRTGLVTCSYDWDAQYVESTTALISPTEPAAPVPFSMGNASSAFKGGAFGSEAAIDGVRKATVTLTRKLATDRIYLGNEHKDVPVTNGLADIAVSLETDYTVQAKALYELFLKNEADSLVLEAVGNAIGTSGKNDTFAVNVTNAFVDTGGEAPLDGPDLVRNTLAMKGTINSGGTSALKANLITADSAF